MLKLTEIKLVFSRCHQGTHNKTTENGLDVNLQDKLHILGPVRLILRYPKVISPVQFSWGNKEPQPPPPPFDYAKG